VRVEINSWSFGIWIRRRKKRVREISELRVDESAKLPKVLAPFYSWIQNIFPAFLPTKNLTAIASITKPGGLSHILSLETTN